MNFSLLDKIDEVSDGILATILKTEGSSYKKKGAKALFVVDDPFPLYGNLGSLCVDQHILAEGKAALRAGKPRIIAIDTTNPEDIDFGYGTYCGGKIELLLEPVLDAHKKVYANLRGYLERGERTYIAHELSTGGLAITSEAPERRDGTIVEEIAPPQVLYVFGATPLANRIVRNTEEADFDVHVIDWRPDYLEHFGKVSGVKRHNEAVSFPKDAYVVIISHSFHRDKAVLESAIEAGSAYIGLLSSKTRRNRVFAELRKAGISEADIDRISCPIGIDIGGKSDPEIAVSIVAELVRFKNR